MEKLLIFYNIQTREIIGRVRMDPDGPEDWPEIYDAAGLDIGDYDLKDIIVTHHPADLFQHCDMATKRRGRRVLYKLRQTGMTADNGAHIYAGADCYYMDAMDGTEQVRELSAESPEGALHEANMMYYDGLL